MKSDAASGRGGNLFNCHCIGANLAEAPALSTDVPIFCACATHALWCTCTVVHTPIPACPACIPQGPVSRLAVHVASAASMRLLT